MSLHEPILTPAQSQAIGWALIHFLWQGLLIGALLWLALASMRHAAPTSRYQACLFAMLLMLAAPVITTYLLLRGISNPWDYATYRIVLLTGTDHVGADWLNRLLPWLSGFWILGALSLQGRLFIKLICVERIKRSGLITASENLRRDLALLRGRLHVTKAVRIMESCLVTVPSVVGWLKPIILLPAGLVTRLTPEQIRALVAHELAHIRRNDYIVNLIQNVFESLLFFHPMTWWVSNRLRVEREFCCDDIALSVSDSRLQYAKALSSLEELRQQEARFLTAATGGSLMNRIARIFACGNGATISRGLWLAPLVLAFGVMAVVTIMGTGCEKGADGSAIAASQVTGPDAAAGVLSTAQTLELREEIVAGLQKAAETGELTPEQLDEAIELIDENIGCLSSCIESGATTICADLTGPDCCPNVTALCCPEMLEPERCTESPNPDCCETVDVSTIPAEASGCEAIEVCIRRTR